MENKKRDISLDILKGFAIIAVILGHSPVPLVLHHFIYTWHMPLFILVSGYFFREKPLKRMLQDVFRGLVLPYAVTISLVFIFYMLGGTDKLEEKAIGLMAIKGFFNYEGSPYAGIGPLWFLLALAWCRVVYSLLIKIRMSNTWLTLSVMVLSYGGTLCKETYVPFFFLQGMASLIFYHCGSLTKQYMPTFLSHKKIILSIGILALLATLHSGGMELWGLWFSFWPENIFAAIGLNSSIMLIAKVLPPPRHRKHAMQMCAINALLNSVFGTRWAI